MLVHDHRKLVAANARQGIGSPDMLVEPPSDRQQQTVPNDHAVVFVDGLEAVDADQNNRDPAGRLIADGKQRAVEPIEKQLAVGQVCQVVMHRVVEQPLLCAAVLRDIPHQAAALYGPPVRGRHTCGIKREPAKIIADVAHAEFEMDAAAVIVLDARQDRQEPFAVSRVQVLAKDIGLA